MCEERLSGVPGAFEPRTLILEYALMQKMLEYVLFTDTFLPSISLNYYISCFQYKGPEVETLALAPCYFSFLSGMKKKGLFIVFFFCRNAELKHVQRS